MSRGPYSGRVCRAFLPTRNHFLNSIISRWFGLVLLPLATYSADGLLAIGHFLRYIVRHFRGQPAQSSILVH
ncbi:hypothetical protein C8R41DRAFT_344091 [Lentinula lateritia]|uniref:Uncharacterized protein n=1 Tax=Lentinula lateritia TaxID=40482 RepID=A0ABQ8VG20_9AGAR|nr:hypothetical protein C8R41DRAFT_344091 [Lentinula lateritia]